ncbi:O-antigen ligase family protein [Riemerella anatipestifer]|uniref:O-antigen ligase family protein n=1 Tax=Riemerella anatipestifer TaxID=34085 RepID=UPI002A8A755B|nr:O-antigen ligase family protein [Riemerella anatipestifer]
MEQKVISLQYINIIYLLIGFPIISLIGIFNLDIPHYYITYPFKCLSLIVCLSIIYFRFDELKNTFTNQYKFVYLFFALYLVSIFIDTCLYKNVYKKSHSYYFFAFVCNAVIPTLGVFLTDVFKLSFKNILKYIFYPLLFFGFVNFIFFDFSLGYSHRSSGVSLMYPNFYGQVGVSLALVSFYYLFKSNNVRLQNILYIAGVFLGLWIVCASGTKNAFLGLIISFSYMCLSIKPSIKKKIFIFTYSIVILLFFKSLDLSLFHRSESMLSYTVQNNSVGERISLYSTVLAQIFEHPIFGSSLFINDKNSFLYSYHAHNLFLESWMSMGLVGPILLVMILIVPFKFIFTIKNDSYLWVKFLFIQYFVQSLFSKSLHTSLEFWVLTALLITLYNKIKNEHKNMVILSTHGRK